MRQSQNHEIFCKGEIIKIEKFKPEKNRNMLKFQTSTHFKSNTKRWTTSTTQGHVRLFKKQLIQRKDLKYIKQMLHIPFLLLLTLDNL